MKTIKNFFIDWRFFIGIMMDKPRIMLFLMITAELVYVFILFCAIL